MRLTLVLLLVLNFFFAVEASVTYTVQIVAGTSNSNCDDSWWNYDDDAVWGAKVNSYNDDYLLMHGSGYSCPSTEPPQTLLTETVDCDSQISQFQLCLVAGDDNENSAGCSNIGTTVQYDELGCVETGCQWSSSWDDCWSTDCSYSQTVAFDISGDDSIYTSGAEFEITRTGNCVTDSPTRFPTGFPTGSPSAYPTAFPTLSPSTSPTAGPTQSPIIPVPTFSPTLFPTNNPTTPAPTTNPTRSPTRFPTELPTTSPTISPITPEPTQNPTFSPTVFPTRSPIAFDETSSPTTLEPTTSPTKNPTTTAPTNAPTTSAPTFSCATELDQCGGDDWEGTTCCLDGYNCTWVNDALSVCQVLSIESDDSGDGSDSSDWLMYLGAIVAFLGLSSCAAAGVAHLRVKKKKKLRQLAEGKFLATAQEDKMTVDLRGW